MVSVGVLLDKLNEVLHELPVPADQPVGEPTKPESAPEDKKKAEVTPPQQESQPIEDITREENRAPAQPPDIPLPPEEIEIDSPAAIRPEKNAAGASQNETTPPTVEIHPHEKDVRKDWLDFIAYVKDRKVWMAQDLQRADKIKQENGELHLTYDDSANCSVLRQKANHQLLTEFSLDFFQQPIKIRFIVPENDNSANGNGEESPQRKRQELANDSLVLMTAEIFNGQVGDIRIGPRSR